MSSFMRFEVPNKQIESYFGIGFIISFICTRVVLFYWLATYSIGELQIKTIFAGKEEVICHRRCQWEKQIFSQQY